VSGPPSNLITTDLQAELERLRAEVAQLKQAKKNVQHSVETDDWGTPVPLVEAGRRVLGGFDFDPFSSDYWNYWTVKAALHYTADDNGMAQPWSGRGFFNPPSGKVPGTRKSLARAAWERLVEHWLRGEVDCALWVGYSLEQLTNFQGSPMHPLQWWTVMPCERQAFLIRGDGDGPPVESTAPSHGNYVTLLHSRRDPELARAQAHRFRAEAQRLGGIAGALVRPL